MVVDADTITIDGRYTLQPDATDPHFLDVNLVGTAPVVTLGGVDSDFVGGCAPSPGSSRSWACSCPTSRP